MATPARNPRGKRTENSDPNRPLISATPKKPMIKNHSSSTPKTHSAPRAKKSSATATTPRTPALARGKKPVASSAQKRSKKKEGLGLAMESDEAAAGGTVGGELEGSSKVRKMRSMMLEEAMSSIPEPGAGRVMHMVKAFERLLSLTKDGDDIGGIEAGGRVVNWALPGLRQPRAEGAEVSSCFDFSTTPERSSVDSNGDRLSWGSSTSYGDQRSRSKSTCSSGRSWNSKLRATSQQPFKLRTELRGKLKEENFLNKMKQMLLEEEKQRIPIAQGLPWTTDNPECLVKPCLKESTEPVDLVLHSDVRAVERAEFDFHVSERLSFIEQIKLERERLRKLEEEEEVRRLRRELVPKAQPMPYFDRPFVPKKKSQKTLPKEPSPTVSKEPSPRTTRTHTKKTSVRKSLKLGHGRLREER